MRYLVVIFVAASAAAAPLTPEVIAAERAWAAAETEKDPRAAPVAWKAAAVAFDKAVAAAPEPLSFDLAYSAVLAWKNALGPTPSVTRDANAAPTSLSTDEVALVRAIDICLAVAPPDEAATLLFIRARVDHAHGRLPGAVATWTELVTKHPAHETAEFAAQLLLDALNRQGKFDELGAMTERMRNDKKLLANRPDLATMLDRLHVQFLRKLAESQEAVGRQGDRSGFQKCAKTYRDAYAGNPTYDRRDELLFNAGVCFAAAGQVSDARQAYRDLIARFPKSGLVASARSRLADLPP